ncbi:MAG: hypothetical protein IKF97_04895 [Clostridia bacterium]|nr:hypothetical protein [Clostridia bacterium]
MEIIAYSIVAFCVSLIIQFIIMGLIERRKRKKKSEESIEKIYGNNMKIAVKILIAIVISVVIAVITFYVVGIICLGMLREGH